MSTPITPIVPIILVGGSGTRLWPLSRSQYPKQFTKVIGDKSLFQQTAERVSDKHLFAAPIIVANEEYRFMAAEQLRLVNITHQGIILEPAAKSTAPAIALAALRVAQINPDARLLVLPSDHYIKDSKSFQASVANAYAASATHIVTFGITPDKPETGYGYIQHGELLPGDHNCFTVKRFVEKPGLEQATAFIAERTYAWNSGIFFMSANVYLDELRQHAPEVLKACEAAMQQASSDEDFIRPAKEPFVRSPSISIDHAVMEKTSRAATLAVSVGWYDLGAWNSLLDMSEKDAQGNVLQGKIIIDNVSNSYIRTDKMLVAAVGIKDIMIVVADNAVLVGTKNSMQDVRKLVEKMKAEHYDEADYHSIHFRPWGSFQGIDKGDRFQVKRLTIKPGAKISLQRHQHRAEHWIVVNGTATVTCGNEMFQLYENQSTFIPQGAVHRLENRGKTPLHIIEVQSGSYLGEDDIERFEDSYGRTGTNT